MMYRTALLALIGAYALFASTVNAQVRNAESEKEARAALDAFITAWNTGENEKLRETMSFPFITLFGARMIVAEEPADFATDFEGMREREQWARSSFDSFRAIAASRDKVHCEVDYSRYRADGTRYGGGRIFYIVTRQNGRWGLQFRSPIPSSPIDESKRTEAESGAKRAVLDFFTGFNAADSDATARTLNYPHAFLLGGGRVALAENGEGALARANFAAMRERENWHMSTIDSLDARSVAEGIVHFELVFSRWHPDGTRYRTVPALWIMTRRGDHWGIQFRSLMPPTYSAGAN